MGVEIAGLMDATKRLALVPAWAKIGEELSFVMPLEVDSVTIPLSLRARTSLRQPDRNVMLQIEFVPVIGKTEPLCRLDWRPFHNHNNRNRGPKEFRFVVMAGSHNHAFDLNWSAEAQRMIGKNLPVAMPLAHEMSFDGLLAVLAQSAKIQNASDIPPPSWEQGLI